MARREGYFNPFRETVNTKHGKVLFDVNPSKGVIHTTTSIPMGKQYKDLLTTLRKFSESASYELFHYTHSLTLI